MATNVPALEPAAGFSLESPASRPDRVPLQKGQYSIASRAVALSTYFLSGALAINLSQFLGAPLALVNQDWYNAWIAFTKQSFGLLTMTLTQTFAPTKVIVSGDASVRGQLLKSVDGDLVLDFPERLILIANHQIYTDWLYLWWIAYCNGMHGRLYIILKESLKKIPVLGWGMQFNQFIFLKRNWEHDRPNMATALQKLNKLADPMWLLLFPEGTNLASSTRAKSAAWAKKNNIPDTRHVLLPRSTGLHFCLEQLRDSVDYVYDCTVAYEGVPRGQYAQDIFTLKAGYLEGRPPKSVSMHWRRFAAKEIPNYDEKAFELWLLARWREKDVLIEKWYQTGRFPADIGVTKYKSGRTLRGCGHMEVPIRSSHWYEFLQIFAPMGILAMVLYIFYGDLPQRFWKSINRQALQASSVDVKRASAQAGRQVKAASSSVSSLTLDSFFDPTQQEDTFKAGAMAVQKLLNSPSAQTLLNRADFIQQFLSDPQKMVTDSITDKQQNFMHQLANEEARRQRDGLSSKGSIGQNSARLATGGTSATKRGTFWSQVNAEERNRQGSAKSGNGGSTKGTFWQNLKAVEDKKNAPAHQGTFWDDMKAEENSRYGTVVTLSSDASTAVASTNSTSTRGTAPKLGPRKLPSSRPGNKTQRSGEPKTAVAKKQALVGSVSTNASKKISSVTAQGPSSSVESTRTSTQALTSKSTNTVPPKGRPQSSTASLSPGPKTNPTVSAPVSKLPVNKTTDPLRPSAPALAKGPPVNKNGMVSKPAVPTTKVSTSVPATPSKSTKTSGSGNATPTVRKLSAKTPSSLTSVSSSKPLIKMKPKS